MCAPSANNMRANAHPLLPAVLRAGTSGPGVVVHQARAYPLAPAAAVAAAADQQQQQRFDFSTPSPDDRAKAAGPAGARRGSTCGPGQRALLCACVHACVCLPALMCPTRTLSTYYAGRPTVGISLAPSKTPTVKQQQQLAQARRSQAAAPALLQQQQDGAVLLTHQHSIDEALHDLDALQLQQGEQYQGSGGGAVTGVASRPGLPLLRPLAEYTMEQELAMCVTNTHLACMACVPFADWRSSRGNDCSTPLHPRQAHAAAAECAARLPAAASPQSWQGTHPMTPVAPHQVLSSNTTHTHTHTPACTCPAGMLMQHLQLRPLLSMAGGGCIS